MTSIAAIFDMDGTLIRSEENQSRAFAAILEREGASPQKNSLGLLHNPGVREEGNWKQLRKQYNISTPVEELKEARQPVYMDILRKNPEAMPGAVELVKDFTEYMPVAITSSAPRQQVEAVISLLQLEPYITTFVSGDDVSKGKPDPECYLSTAAALDVDPAGCVVFEDAQAGVEAGKNAGMYVVAVPTPFTTHQNFTQADVLSTSLEDVSALTIEEILMERIGREP